MSRFVEKRENEAEEVVFEGKVDKIAKQVLIVVKAKEAIRKRTLIRITCS